MKIKFLGTSAGWPLPRLGCLCEVCVSSNPKDTRTRSQLLINDFLLLDAGIDTYNHLNNADIDPQKIKFAAITHEHSDHTLGFQDLSHIYLSNKKGGIGKKAKIEVIIHPKTFSKIKNIFYFRDYKITKVEKATETRVDNLKLELLPVNHTTFSFGILVSEGDKKIFYAPDMKSLPEETFDRVKGVDLIAFDGSELSINIPSHQSIDDGIKLGKKLDVKKIFFVHIGHRTLPHNELMEYVKKVGGSRFNASYDNLELIL